MLDNTLNALSDPREEVLRLAFIEGAHWPLDPASLNALINMGMSYTRIAKYFAVKPVDVCDLRRQYGIVRSVCDRRNTNMKEV